MKAILRISVFLALSLAAVEARAWLIQVETHAGEQCQVECPEGTSLGCVDGNIVVSHEGEPEAALTLPLEQVRSFAYVDGKQSSLAGAAPASAPRIALGSDGSLTVDGADRPMDLTVADAAGAVVRRQRLESYPARVDVAGLAPGVYVVATPLIDFKFLKR